MDAQRIFISYRRSDCQAQANGLNDGLRNRLPGASIFMDLDSIPPGTDFEEYIRHEIERCDVVLVLIGDNWLDPRPGSSARRIDEPGDFVRLEVLSSLRSQRVRVIPVLVEGAAMPSAGDLPDDIAGLARLNAFVLSDSHWSRDIHDLTDHLRKMPEPAPRQQAPRPPGPPMTTSAPSRAAAPPRGDRPPAYTGPPPARSPAAPARPDVISRTAYLMMAAPLLSCGLLAFLPPLWAGGQLKHDAEKRRRMHVLAAVVGAAVLLGITLVGVSPVDESGAATGPLVGIGVILMLASMCVGVAVAFRFRRRPVPLAGAAEELDRRERRRSYRELVSRDQSLASAMKVGRPDLERSFDDGGLLDLNSLPLDALLRHGRLTAAEADALIRLREQLGRFQGMAEVEAYSTLSPTTLSHLREVAVFV